MVPQAEQVEILLGLNEGDVFEYGVLFRFAPKEKLVWRCEEVAELGSDKTQFTFHIYFMDVMLKAVRAIVDNADKSVDWGVK